MINGIYYLLHEHLWKNVTHVTGHICNMSKFIQIYVCLQPNIFWTLLAGGFSCHRLYSPPSFVQFTTTGAYAWRNIFSTESGQCCCKANSGCNFILITRIGPPLQACHSSDPMVIPITSAGRKEVAKKIWQMHGSSWLRTELSGSKWPCYDVWFIWFLVKA